MKYRAALFDFDGTLTPSLPLWVKAFRLALYEFKFDFSDEQIRKRFLYRDWVDVARELEIDSVQLRDEVHRCLRVVFCEAQLFPFVLSLLMQCREQGLRTALVTSAPKIILDDVIPRLGLHDAFDFVICADDVKNFKPHPEPILTTLSALNCEPHHAIMIGDSKVDILAGKAAGTATALYMTDDHAAFHPADTLLATGPDHIFTDHRELHGIIGLDETSLDAVELIR